jgi:drug/metabolite transporter (DMT)-like permease
LSPHLTAVVQALFVAFLWATSWVLIKIGLGEIPALTFAGLRFTLAAMCLLPLALRPVHRTALRGLPARDWARLIVLGILIVGMTQGTQFLGLSLLPAVTVNLLLSFSTVIVSVAGVFLLSERPKTLQWGGVGLYLAGAAVYFLPVALPASQIAGLLIVLIGVFTNSASALLGRSINRGKMLHPLVVTSGSMLPGALLLLLVGVVTQGLPNLSPLNWLIVGWLAVVNTAFAYTLWNQTQRTLSAMESSIINSTLLIQIPILAVIFLGEQQSAKQVAGLVLAGFGILVVQLRR